MIILMAIMFLVLMVPKRDQYFVITINEINGHEFSVILALNFIFLLVMPISEIFNGNDFISIFYWSDFLRALKWLMAIISQI